MIEEIKNIKSEKSDLRKSGIIVGTVLLIIAGLLFWKEKESFQILLTVGTVLLILSIAIPVILRPIYFAWMVIASILGWIMTRVILIVLYYFVITPISLVFRLSGKQFIDLSWNKRISTYWNYKKQTDLLNGHYEKQF